MIYHKNEMNPIFILITFSLFFILSPVLSAVSHITITGGAKITIGTDAYICADVITVELGGSFESQSPEDVCVTPTGEGDISLPVELSSFTATAGDRQVTLKWITESEVDNMGFHVYRSLVEHGTYERISSELIAGAGNSSTKQTYSFIDRDVVNGITYWYKLEDISIYGTSMMHGPISVKPSLKEPSELLPDTYSLGQNYPNPFNPTTVIPFDLPEKTCVNLVLIDVLGNEVKEITTGEYVAGHHEIELNAADLATGIYFYKIEANGFVDVRKMVVVR